MILQILQRSLHKKNTHFPLRVAQRILHSIIDRNNILIEAMNRIGFPVADEFGAVVSAFADVFQQCQEELYQVDIDKEKMKVLINNITKYARYFYQFSQLLQSLFNINIEQQSEKQVISDIQLKSLSEIDTVKVNRDAKQLLDDMMLQGDDSLALSMANFIVKTLTVIGIPVLTTGVASYVGALVGGILALPTVTFTGPAGIVVAASLGAWIGGGIGLALGIGTGAYATSKVGFFKPIITNLQDFTGEATDFTRTVQGIKSTSPAPAA